MRTSARTTAALTCAALVAALVAILGAAAPSSAATGWKTVFRSGDGKVLVQVCGNATSFTPRVINRRRVRLDNVWVAVLRERDGSGPAQFIQRVAPLGAKRGVPMRRFTRYVAAAHRGVVQIRNRGQVSASEGRFNTELLNSIPRCA